MAGRKPKLTKDKGDRKYQRDRTKKVIEKNKNIDELPDNPPTYLKSHAKKMWTKIVPILKKSEVVKYADSETVEMLCVNYELAIKAYNHIQKHGQVREIYVTKVNPVTGDIVGKDFYGYRRNPSTQILDSATTKIRSLSSELGLTPVSRAELLKIKPEDKDELGIGDILNQKGNDF